MLTAPDPTKIVELPAPAVTVSPCAAKTVAMPLPERHGVVAGQRVDRGVAQTAGQIDPVATGENDVGAGGAACDRRDRIAADPAASPHVVDRRRARRADLDRHIAELPGAKGIRAGTGGDCVARAT